MTREINLKPGISCLVDDWHYDRLSVFPWKLSSGGYAIVYLEKRTVGMHHLVLPTPKGIMPDHINGNKLDNRESNLRPATKRQNTINSRKQTRPTSSQYKGVCFDKWTGRWVVKIKTEHKRICIGRFDSEIDAAHAYDDAARRYFGQFAWLNFRESL